MVSPSVFAMNINKYITLNDHASTVQVSSIDHPKNWKLQA